MKNNFYKIKYPKLFLLFLTFVAAYFIFNGRNYTFLNNFLFNLGYFGTFLAGIFFAYGFTTAPATAILLILAKDQNIILSGLIAGFGALVGDLIIFKFIRHYFLEEIKNLSKNRVFNHIHNKIPSILKRYILLALIGFIIASPLPDEIAVVLLSSSKPVSTKLFSIISYTLNIAGIFIILIIGKSL